LLPALSGGKGETKCQRKKAIWDDGKMLGIEEGRGEQCIVAAATHRKMVRFPSNKEPVIAGLNTETAVIHTADG